MKDRMDLHNILVTLCDHVYFQPPPTVVMQYPCIIYRRDFATTEFANNKPYSYTKRYSVTVVDQNPDSEITDKVKELPGCIFDRFYAADNLNHDVFKISF